MLTTLLGTPWQLQCRGKILMIEEIAEPAYKIQRMLRHMRYAGMLDGCVAIALGSWTNCRTPDGTDWTMYDLIKENVSDLQIPVLCGLPFGHGKENWLWQANRSYELNDTACLTPMKLIE